MTTAQKEVIRKVVEKAFRDTSSALCHQLRDRFVQEFEAGHVMLGMSGGAVNGWEDHYGFTETSGRMHLDQELFDKLSTGEGKQWEALSVMLHEAMHTFRDPVTGKDLYVHATGGLGYNPDAHFPYPNSPFFQISETLQDGTPPCVLR